MFPFVDALAGSKINHHGDHFDVIMNGLPSFSPVYQKIFIDIDLIKFCGLGEEIDDYGELLKINKVTYIIAISENKSSSD